MLNPSLGLVIGGARVPVPGVPDLVTWLDDPTRAPLVHDGTPRAHPPTAIVLHTSRGVRGRVQPGSRPSERAELLALYQSRTTRMVSWHLTVDTDGTVIQQCDVLTWMAWHASHANGWTIGIESVQQSDSGDLWSAQVDALVRVLDVLTSALAIPRRVPVGPDGKPLSVQVKAWQPKSERGRAEHWPGVLGHRNLTDHRGPGDPGDGVFEALLAAGYEALVVDPRA